MQALRQSGLTYREIGFKFGVGTARAREIVRGQEMAHGRYEERERRKKELLELRANPALRNLRAITWQLHLILESSTLC
jgi:hypothetical protein